MKRPLSDRDLAVLRQQGILASDETAYWDDTVLIAENVFSHQQRYLEPTPVLVLETKKRILKG